MTLDKDLWPTVLVVDDAPANLSLLAGLLNKSYRVKLAPSGAKALDLAQRAAPDLILLDVMMPEMDGLIACRTLRTMYPELPILMLTARHEVGDRVAGLDAGADDYMVKPYASVELLARVRALLRRSSVSGSSEIFEYQDLRLDPRSRLATRGSRQLDLTKTEFDLLELLVWNAGVVLSRETLYDRIRGYDFKTSSRSLDVYIGYLRSKLEADGEPRLIQTVRGVGFVMR